MATVVLKYGGSSLATIENIKRIAQNIKNYTYTYDKIVVVVSAMGKTTDNILVGINKFNTTNDLENDKLLSTGEAQSAAYLTLALNELGLKAKSFTGYECGIITTNNFLNSYIKTIKNNIKKYLNKNYICVVTGFQGINKNKNITTIGRGGSDTTAVALAKKLNCKCIIKKDVDGIFLFPPVVENNKNELIKNINYDSMNELSASGAKVLAARSVALAKKYNIPIEVNNYLTNNKGSIINTSRNDYEKLQIDGVTFEENVSRLCIKFDINNFDNIDIKLLNFLQANQINFQNLQRVNIGKKVQYVFYLQNNKVKNFSMQFKKVFNKTIQTKTVKSFTKFFIAGSGFSSKPHFTISLIEQIEKTVGEIESYTISETSIRIVMDKDLSSKTFEVLTNYLGAKYVKKFFA